MGAVTGTKALATEFAGDYKLVRVTFTPAAASDTVTLTAAAHGISEIAFVLPKLNNPNTGGAAGLCADIYATFSGLVITVVTSSSAAAAATNWSGVTAELLVVGK